jgi:hypothetical protein
VFTNNTRLRRVRHARISGVKRTDKLSPRASGSAALWASLGSFDDNRLCCAPEVVRTAVMLSSFASHRKAHATGLVRH